MREIILDTETTGIDPEAGHRVIEIACLELTNHLPTGRKYQCYLNPEREVDSEAVQVHGLTTEFLKDKPLFTEVVSEFLAFIGDARLVIHNAEFDVKFLNAELTRLGFAPIALRRAVDTVQLARRKFPGQPASLDALCGRFNIDNTHRTLHGAMLDAELLSEIYIELVGGRQATMLLASEEPVAAAAIIQIDRQVRPKRAFAPTPEELVAHAALIAELKSPIWATA
jgi:DNA polymerase III subunit epsilon